MINFRQKAQMFVAFPKRVFAVYKDLTMPRRNWAKYDAPAQDRLPSRAECASEFPPKRDSYADLWINQRKKA